MKECFRKDKSSLIQRNQCISDNSTLDETDYFSLLKLIPFDRKLMFFERILTNEKLGILLIKAIFSDLADEYLTFMNSDYNTAKLQMALSNWTAFSSFDFS